MALPTFFVKQLLHTFYQTNTNGPPEVFDKTASPHLVQKKVNGSPDVCD